MTENEVIVMMAEAIDKDKQYAPLTCSTKHLMIFAEMVAKREREACAKIVASKKYYHIPRKNQLWLVLLEIADDIRKQGQLNTGIEKLGLNVRTEHHLKAEDIFSIEQLECCTEDRLLKTPNIGSKNLKEIKEQMAKFGYKLRDKNE